MRRLLDLLATPRGGSLALVILTFAVFAPALSFEFTLDSKHFLGVDQRLRSFDLLALLGTDYWNHGADSGRELGQTDLYRPLPLIWLSALLQLTPAEQLVAQQSWPVQFGNILLHAIGAVLRFLLLRQLLAARPLGAQAAFGAAALLAVHPVATEAVCTAVGACESWAVIGTTGALLAFARWQATRSRHALAAHVVLLLAGLLAKENAAAAVLLVPALAWLVLGQTLAQAARSALPACLALLVWLGARALIFGSLGGAADPVFAGFAPLARLATALAAFATYDIPALLWPSRLLPLVSHQDVPLLASLGDARALLGLGVLTALAGTALWHLRRDPALAFGLLWFLLAFLPVSNLLISIGALAATRFLHLPLFGLGLALASLATARPRLGGAALLAGIGMSLVFTWREVPIWRSPSALFAAAHKRAASTFHGLNHGYALQTAASEAERRKDTTRATSLRKDAAAVFEAAALTPRPSIPGTDLVPEDLLDASFLAAMSAAMTHLTSTRDLPSAVRMLELADTIAARGMAQRERIGSTTVWGNHRSDVWLTRAEHALNEAARAPARRDQLLAEADAALTRAREYWSGNWKVELVAAKTLLVRGDKDGYARTLASLYERAKPAMRDDSRASEVGTTYANSLMSRNERELGTKVMLETALEGRRFVADLSGFFSFGRQGLQSKDAETRRLAQEALTWFVARADARWAEQRREAERLLAGR